MNKINAQNIYKSFQGLEVLKGINLSVDEGEVVAVIGPSGGGKSTFLRCLNKLEIIDSGKIVIDGETLAETKPDGQVVYAPGDESRRIACKMGMVFQYSALFDFLTVGENVAFGLRQHTDKSNEEIQGIVTQMLDLVGLPGTQDLYPAELSGGMKKRVGLARAIAVNPEIVLYDEPTAGLDPIMSRNISRLIKKTQEQLHVTSVLVTHDMQSAFYAADRVAMLYEGHIVAIGTAEEMKNSTNPIVKAFIEGREIKEQVIK